MKHLWRVSLSLACCLVAAAIWTGLLRHEHSLPDLREALETAHYLRTVSQPQAIVSPGRPNPERPLDRAEPSRPPPAHYPSGPAVPLATYPLAEPTPIELSASGLSAPSVSVSPANSQSRVSIIKRLPPVAEESGASRETRARLSPQDRQMAGSHLHYGRILARKGATASARGEFLNALAVIAQSRDQQVGGKHHLSALQFAIRTLEEADDFDSAKSGSDLDADVASIAAGHLSGVLTSAEAGKLSRTAAIATYHQSARENLEFACGHNHPLAAEALFALGRLHSLLGEANPAEQSREFNTSITFHQAALAADPANFSSAHELGVLLARRGEWAVAKELLLRSLALSPRRETWTNLATLHRRMGEVQLAELAAREAELLAARTENSTAPMIRLVPTSEFEAVPDTQDVGPANQTAQQSATQATTQLR